MTQLNINVQEPYFSLIKQGIKTVEGRLGKEKFRTLKAGDTLIINDEIKKEIVAINIYQSFSEMLIMEGIKNTIPDAKSLDVAVSVYYKFFTPEDELKFGVCAIKLK